jgi:nucleoid-associated protein YgaU
MRTEYKIGLAVGLFILIVFVVYYGLTMEPADGPQGKQPPVELAQQDEPPPSPASDDLPAFDDPRPLPSAPEPDDPISELPAGPDLGDDPFADDPLDDGQDDDSGVVAIRFEDADDPDISDQGPGPGEGFQPAQPAPEPSPDPRLASRTPDDRDDSPLPDFSGLRGVPRRSESPRRRQPGLGSFEPIDEGFDPSTTPRTVREYVVQPGDNGFWVIAEKVYGNGKHWELIRDANPTVDTNNLRAGMKLKVPPKPQPNRSPNGDSGTGRGLVTTLTGQKKYVVQSGDNGFWGVSKAVYGHGKYWTLIRDANPNVNTSTLQPGMELVVPPKPQASAAGRSARSPLLDVNLPAGHSTYTVQSGDRGFWGVSEKAYGNGAYWPVIRDANPTVDSDALMPGMKLVIPPKPSSPPRAIAPRSPERSPTPAADADSGTSPRPDFSGRLD